MRDCDEIYLSDGFSVDAETYAIMEGRKRAPSETEYENYKKDLAAFESAGLTVETDSQGSVIDGKYFIRKNSRIWRKVEGSFSGREYRYKSPDAIITLARTGVWQKSELSDSRAASRAKSEAAADRKRRTAYMRQERARLAAGGKLLRGGASSPHPSSGFFGVAWNQHTSNWGVMVSRPHVKKLELKSWDQMKRVGFYNTILEAALAFDAANTEMRGIYARTNFPKGSTLVSKDGVESVLLPDGRIATTIQPDDRPNLIK